MSINELVQKIQAILLL